jgi:hypothetical protein
MDPIHPIAPGPPLITTRLPVEALERISRERDRPSKDSRRRHSPAPHTPAPEGEHVGDDDERPHVDVQV